MKIKRKPFTEAEIEKIHAMRAKGIKWTEIAAEVGRPVNSLHGKFSKGAKKKMKAAPVPRKYIKSRMANAPAVTKERPMIALVGNPSEVTNSLRELFS